MDGSRRGRLGRVRGSRAACGPQAGGAAAGLQCLPGYALPCSLCSGDGVGVCAGLGDPLCVPQQLLKSGAHWAVPHSHCDPTWKQGFRSYYKSTVRDILEAVVRFLFGTHARTRGQREEGRAGARARALGWVLFARASCLQNSRAQRDAKCNGVGRALWEHPARRFTWADIRYAPRASMMMPRRFA